jgi:CrcB protein
VASEPPVTAPCEPTAVDLVDRVPAARHRSERLLTVVVVGLGGALGAGARFLAAQAWPAAPGHLPTTTLVVNVAGCGLIGVLMVMVSDVWTRTRLLRPFLGTGVLGGFTTFSTYTVDVQRLLVAGRPLTALLYLAGTAVAALLAVWVTAAATRRLVTSRVR